LGEQQRAARLQAGGELLLRRSAKIPAPGPRPCRLRRIPGTEEAHATDAATGGETGGAAATTQVAETVEFTGTVVQAGSPIILDNGTETRQIEADAELRLGEEVTVRGTETDGTIDADDVF